MAESGGAESQNAAPAEAAAAAGSTRSGMVASSGLGQLTKMLNDHMDQMKSKDEWVDKFLTSFASSTLLKDAKIKAVETETRILKAIMDDIMEMTDFLNNIILIENKFNALYEPHKKEQEAARAKYAPNIAKYEIKPKVNSEVGSFVELMFGGQTVHSGSFQKWLDSVNNLCQEKNIKVLANSGAHCKKIERAFYKAFYVYSSSDNDQGYKEMTDVIRCSIVFDSFNDLYKAYSVIEEIAEKDLSGGILRLKDRFHPKHMPFGYRDLLINVYCPGSKIVCEMQLHHILFYKLKKISHRMYVKARLFEREGYNAAYDYATKYVRPRITDKCYEIADDDVITNIQQAKKQQNNAVDDAKDEEEEEIDFRELLKKWKLDKYAQAMEDEGWEDPIDWCEITEEDLKNDLNFSKGHIKKFQRKYKEWQQTYNTKQNKKKPQIDDHKDEQDTQNNALLEAQRKLLEEQKRLEERQKQMMAEQEAKYKVELEKLKTSNIQKWEHKVFVYQSDFDEYGIVYGLATEWGALSWQNPAESGKILMRASSVKADGKPLSALVGRQTIRFLCDEMEGAWFSLDFLELRICPTYYSLRHYATWNIEALRYWDFEGSIDGVNWTTIKRHRNDSTLKTKGAPASWSVNSPYYFSQFRVKMTGRNDNGHWYLACSGIEIYGVVKRGAAAKDLPKPIATEHKEDDEETIISDLSAGKVFKYEKDFDTNGIIHWLGTNKGKEDTFKNPVDRGLATVSSVKLVSKSVDVKHILGKNTVRIATDAIERGWIGIDLGDVYIKPTKYSLKHYISWDTEALRTWELHASNGCRPGVSPEYLIIRKHENDNSLNKKGATKSWNIPPIATDEAFNKFRIVLTAPNSNDHWHLACSGFEIYGQVLDSVPSYVTPAKPVDSGKEVVFEYKSDFDENGLLFYLGSYAKTKQWGNPRAAGIIRVSASSLGPDSLSIDSFVGRKAVRCLTKDAKNSDMMIDLIDSKMNVTDYTLRHYSSWDTEALREWNLEGSNDGANWVILKSHKKDKSLHEKGATHTWKVSNKGWFRYFRVILTGPNDNNHYYLCCSGIELYGAAVGGFVSNPPLHQKQSDPDPPHKAFIYCGKEFDTNGLLYHIGTMNGTQKWSNPHSSSLCAVSASSITADSESIINFCGRTAVRCVTKESERADMMIDLKEIRIQLTHYTLRHYSSGDTQALRNWDLEGSHDAKAWLTLKTHKKDEALCKKGQAVTWPVENVAEFFRYFRIILTGPNSTGHNVLACSGIEFYGVAAGGIIANPVKVEPPPQGPYRQFKHATDFDTNGIIYWLGTRGGTAEWQNPATFPEAPPIIVQSSPLMADSQPISSICGRSLVRCATQDKVNAWWLLKFGKMRVCPTHYTLKHYSSWDTECLRDWKLEGKNPDGKWKLICNHKNDESLKKKGATATFEVKTTEFFQQLSVMMTGKNSNDHWYLCCSGVEVYGICAGGYVNKSNANLETLPAVDDDENEAKEGTETDKGAVQVLGETIFSVLSGSCDIKATSSGVTVTATEGFPSIRGNFNLKKKAWYYEIQLLTDQCMQFGFADDGFCADSDKGNGVGDDKHSWAYDGWRQKKWNGDNTRYGGDVKWKPGDIIGCCVDCYRGEVRFYLNGKDLGVAFIGAQFNDSCVFPAASLSGKPAQSAIFVFDAAYFKNPIPSGYNAINTCNYFTDPT